LDGGPTENRLLKMAGAKGVEICPLSNYWPIYLLLPMRCAALVTDQRIVIFDGNA
jgi:hypothetical protein